MSPEAPESTPVKLSELVDAFEFVSASNADEHRAYICKKTGRIIFVVEGVDFEEEIDPADLDTADYIPAPHRQDLDLGRQVALSFIADELPGAYDKAMEIFSRKGAYARFKRLLQATGTLEKWYAFEQLAIEKALVAWCEEVGVALIHAEPGK